MKKILIAVLALLLVLVAAIGIGIATFDINKYKPQIQAAISKETGRSVKFGGDIHVGFSLAGVTLSIKDVSLGNPPWASRENLATIKQFDLKVALLPLAQHKIDIDGLGIDDADILLENQNEFRHNWDMYEAGEPAAPAPATGKDKAVATEAATPVEINLTNLAISNSRVAMMGPDRKQTVFKADSLKLGSEGSGLGLHFTGSLNDAPIKLAATTNAATLMSKAARPVDISLNFANFFVTAKGMLDSGAKKANFDSYEFSTGSTKATGHLMAAWGGARPEIQGTVTSEQVNLADFKSDKADSDATAAKSANPNAPQRVFSDAPLALGSLKSADVNLDVVLAALSTGSVELKNLKTKLVINNGHLFASPLTMNVGAGTVAAQVSLDAGTAPARLGTTVAVNDVDISDLIKVWGAEAFLSGKVKADVNFASSGNSLHELASNLSGPLAVIGAGGDVISTASNKISAGISEILSPGSSKNEGMNCIVARFLAQTGVVKGNGILIDTGAATVAGYGDIDLRSETLNLDFHAKPKVVSVGGLLPKLHVGGTLAKPDVGADAQDMIKNVGNLLTGGSVADPVPDLVTQQGQNACAYTLDHPSAAAPAAANKGGVVQDVAGKAGTLIKGLFGGQ